MAKNENNTSDALREAERRVGSLKKQRLLECDHSSKGGVMYLNQYGGVVRDAHKYSDTTFIHPDCGAIFEGATYSKAEVEKIFFDLQSMGHQIKMITGKSMSEKNKEDLMRCMEYAEYLEQNLGVYYNSMVEKLADNSNKNSQRGDRKVGGIGVNASMFS